jgi:hypothetical protein
MTGQGSRPTHKFRIGQLVTLTHPILKRRIGGIYEVVALVPDDGHGISCRVKSPDEDFERTVLESELTETVSAMPDQRAGY